MPKCVASLVAALLLLGVQPSYLSSQNPFATTNWKYVLAHDPKLTVNVRLSKLYSQDPGYRAVAPVIWVENKAANIGGFYCCFARNRDFGEVGPQHTWMAAVPLDDGGNGGASTWLIYSAKEPKTYASAITASNGRGEERWPRFFELKITRR